MVLLFENHDWNFNRLLRRPHLSRVLVTDHLSPGFRLRPSVRPSVFVSACVKWQTASLYFIKHDKETCERKKKTEEVKHSSCTAAPPPSVFLSVCLSVQMLAFDASCFTFSRLYLSFMLNLSPVVSILLASFSGCAFFFFFYSSCLFTASLIRSFCDSQLNFCYSLCHLPLKRRVVSLCFLCKRGRLLILKWPAWLSEG